MTTADLVTPQAAEGAEAPAPPATAAEAEELVRELDARREAVARRHQVHDRDRGGGVDEGWSRVAAQITAEGLKLDRQRGAARKLARELKEREASRAARKAWYEVYPEHCEICSRIVSALDELLPALEAELALHRLLKERAGRSMLPDLCADLEKLHRLRRSAAVVGRPNEESVQ